MTDEEKVKKEFVSAYFVECDSCSRLFTIREIWYKNTGERYCDTCMKLDYPEWKEHSMMYAVAKTDGQVGSVSQKKEKKSILNELFKEKKNENKSNT